MMPNYSGSMIKCFQDLSRNKQLKRGSALLWRYYTPPDGVRYEPALVPMPEIPKYK